MPRVALFLDVENLYNALKRFSQSAERPYGTPPHWVDFGQLVDYIETHYGTLAREDFIAVANFTHYDAQWGGLNRYATVVDAQSFYTADARRLAQPMDGVKYVIEQYADMVLAFEVGRHVTLRLADIYILGSGDEAFVALGRILRDEYDREVYFLVPREGRAVSLNIRAEFPLIFLEDTQTTVEEVEQVVEESISQKAPQSKEPPPADSVEVLCDLVRTLRRELTCGIPVRLVAACLGPTRAEALLRKAQGEGRVDLWDSPEGVRCVSLREERLYDRVQPIAVRESVAQVAELLYLVAEVAEQAPPRADRVYWRQALRRELGLSNRKAKELLEQLLGVGVLRDGEMNHPRITVKRILHLERLLSGGGEGA